MSYSSMAVRFFTAPKPLGNAMDHHNHPNTQKSAGGEPQGHTVVRPNVSTEHPSSRGVELHKPIAQGLTFANQDSLPKLPIPDLEDTCRRHLDALAALQGPREHEDTKAAVRDFLKTDGPVMQEKLKNYASSKTSYIEQFCKLMLRSKKEIIKKQKLMTPGYDSYLNFDNRKTDLTQM